MKCLLDNQIFFESKNRKVIFLDNIDDKDRKEF